MYGSKISRKWFTDWLASWLDKDVIKVVTGIHRCGKTTLFELFREQLVESGRPCYFQVAYTVRDEATLDYLDKRRGNMRYGWLRRNGYCISSSHVEAAARILVARRCKQAGMHWRHHNAACVCAIIARLRSVA